MLNSGKKKNSKKENIWEANINPEYFSLPLMPSLLDTDSYKPWEHHVSQERKGKYIPILFYNHKRWYFNGELLTPKQLEEEFLHSRKPALKWYSYSNLLMSATCKIHKHYLQLKLRLQQTTVNIWGRVSS